MAGGLFSMTCYDVVFPKGKCLSVLSRNREDLLCNCLCFYLAGRNNPFNLWIKYSGNCIADVNLKLGWLLRTCLALYYEIFEVYLKKQRLTNPSNWDGHLFFLFAFAHQLVETDLDFSVLRSPQNLKHLGTSTTES
jgi:hypothetical protein